MVYKFLHTGDASRLADANDFDLRDVEPHEGVGGEDGSPRFTDLRPSTQDLPARMDTDVRIVLVPDALHGLKVHGFKGSVKVRVGFQHFNEVALHDSVLPQHLGVCEPGSV